MPRQRPEALNATREVGQIVEDVVLVDVAMRSSVDVDNPRPGRVFDHVGNVRRLPAREDVKADVARRQRASQFTYVNVHAARFPATQRCQRTCMHAENGDLQGHAACHLMLRRRTQQPMEVALHSRYRPAWPRTAERRGLLSVNWCRSIGKQNDAPPAWRRFRAPARECASDLRRPSFPPFGISCSEVLCLSVSCGRSGHN